MPSKPLGFAIVIVACLAAVAGGGYLALRQTAPLQPSSVSPAPAASTLPGAAMTVAETEGVIGDASAAVETPGDTAAPRSASNVSTGPTSASTRETSRKAPRATRESAGARSSSRQAGPTGTPVPEPSGPVLKQSWPTREAAGGSPAEPPASAPIPSLEDTRAPELPAAPEPPQKIFQEYIVAPDSVIGLQLETPITSERARVEDPLEARVTRDVKVGDEVVIPAGTRVLGSVALVERGGKVKERARLGIRFHTLVLADGTRTAIVTETIYREGISPAGESAAKIGGAAVGGAILGAILGGGKGAVVGGSVGAAGGTAAVMAGGRNAVVLPAGSTLTARVSEPVTITVEK